MQPTTMLPKLTDTTQTISFSEADGVCSAEVFANDVVVSTNAGSHLHGSSKVKLKNLVDYNWETKFYTGQLLAIHMSGQYLAYSIKAQNAMNPGTWSGMVRVVHTPEPGIDRRVLIKGMNGEVQDLAFAHVQGQVVLASIDEQGHFYVHEIETTESGLRCTLLVEVSEAIGVSSPTHRVVWCPYIPDEDDDSADDVAWLLLTTHANVARMWNIREAIAAGGGTSGGVARSQAISEHAAHIVHAAFSPDGTALATAAADGFVMFFQVYMHNETSPRCLHKWQPHSGKPLSCLFFLDNHNNCNNDVQFWKFAVTGAENNTTIKIWSCKTWTCLQTISFTTNPGSEPAALGMKAQLDTSAKYLILSDFKARSLYVLNMVQDRDDILAYCKSISEFLLPYPVLSFCIVDAGEEQVKCSSSCNEAFHLEDSDDPPRSPEQLDLQRDDEVGGLCATGPLVRVRLFIVQPKGLQEGELLYAPSTPQPLPDISTMSLEDEVQESIPSPMASSILQQQTQQLKNLLMRSQTQPGSLIGQRPESPQSIAPPLNLMTPDAFSSPGKREEEDPPLSGTPDLSPEKPRSSITGTSVSGVGATKLTSGGSSPSREVQLIMAHDQPCYPNQKEEEITSEIPVEEPATSVQNGDAIYPPDLFVDSTVNHNSTETSWPEVPIELTYAESSRCKSCDKSSVKSVDKSSVKSGEKSSFKLCDKSSIKSGDKSSNQSLNTSGGSTTSAIAVNVNAAGDRARADSVEAHPHHSAAALMADARLDQLDKKLDKLADLVMSQSRELRALRAATSSPRDALENALHAHSQRTAAAVDAALDSGWERVARMGEACGMRCAQAAGAGAARALEPLATALQHELAAKLTATDHLLRENIDKLANSKAVMERLSTAIAKSLSDMVKESLRETLKESVVPMMEKAHAQMFRQINQAFQNGTREFLTSTEAASRAAAERGAAGACGTLTAALERHAAALQQQQQPQHLAALIQDAAHSALEKELSWWRGEARAVMVQASRAHSPAASASQATTHDRQVQVGQIQSLINSGDVNSAFQLALSASDLSLVMAACRAADPAAVFAPHALRQHVLLSLVQQLSADMQRDTLLKHRYLEEAIMNLDTSNPVTREHLPVVIRELQKHIMAFINTNPGHALTRQFKMLLMATDSLIKNSG